VKFTDIRKEIATYDPERVLSRESMSALECDLWFYQQYYFSNNDDPGRLAELRAKLAAANPAFVGIESFVMDTAPSGWMPVHAFHFERREQWTAEGSAFEHWPATEAVAGQSMISGNIGKFASSSTESSIDRATGRLLSEPFLIRGQVMTLRVGGGRLPNTQRVSLLVGGRPLFNATGCSSEILGQRIWNLAGLEGRAAQIEIVDSGAGDWQHILVDEIIEWQRL
jgi:hypothetical protein